MGPGGESYLVAVRGGKVLGFAALRGAELAALFVRPRWQGAGIGRALVEAAGRIARRSGQRRLRVLAARAAVEFYSAIGFRGSLRARVPLPGGLALAAVRMRLPLGRP
jgi:GNAT superfamily N-acetyltransferase